MTQSTSTRTVLGPGETTTVTVPFGEILRIRDIAGGACCQLVIVNHGDARERFSAPNTMLLNKKVYFDEGSVLHSYLCNPMMTITATDVTHDALPGTLADPGPRPGAELLAEEAAGLGLAPHQVPYPFLAFTHHTITDSGYVGAAASVSNPGSFIDLRAEFDVDVVLANTPDLLGEGTGDEPPGALEITLLEEEA